MKFKFRLSVLIVYYNAMHWNRTFVPALRIAALFLNVVAAMAFATPPGIPRSLARERSVELSNIRYGLHFTLDPHANSTHGQEELRFELARPVDLPLDFRDGTVTRLSINRTATPVHSENGHLLLPADNLKAGENLVALDFTAPVAAAGRAVTRFEDKDDSSVYFYTLFVPMDASMAFPCFDQPDLKARFKLEVIAETGSTVISNAKLETIQALGAVAQYVFSETLPVSTYLFAFAAGPFQKLNSAAGLPGVYVRKSQVNRAAPEISQIQKVTVDGMKFLAGYFAQSFPFPKYDLILIPGFPYGGMEHAGATFLSEDAMLFRNAPTETDRFNRSVIILHELAHQWFGDFTTMRWFDDLWLKEGFAQYMAYRTLDALTPDQHVWMRFYQNIKPAAYSTDETKGTTPIYQDIPNLLDAKSAYGAIVYSKAPGLLRQLAFLIGEEPFRNGLRAYLHEHAYGNAEWSDLVHAFERSSGRRLNTWAEAWIHRRGLPTVTAAWACDAEDRLTSLSLHQRDALAEGGVWPFATEVLLGTANGASARLRVDVSGATANVAVSGRPCPAYVFANADDHAYGIFLPDSRSRAYLTKHAGSVADPFERALLWGSLWDSVQFAEMDPRDYLSSALASAGSETEEPLLRSLTAHSTTALHRYLSAAARDKLVPQFETLALDRTLNSPTSDLRIVWFRALTAAASTPAGLDPLKRFLSGQTAVSGVKLRPLDRWSIIATLLSQNDPAASRIYDAEQTRDRTGEGLKYSYVVGAARPDPAIKEKYFADYLNTAARPEDWIEASLLPFNQWNQSALTAPYLKPALNALPQIKRERKIFFLVAWLNAFLGGQQSAEADREVHRWLDTATLDPDLRFKILQSLDALDRTVAIRERFHE